jgi:glycosyltransferase involved in cell wall biosynthesis
MGEIIKDGVHGFVINERNPNLYIDKINRSNNDATLKQMGIECRRLAENYSWKKQSNKYYRLYNRLLESY